jgi:AraC-like DNA-binding protein
MERDLAPWCSRPPAPPLAPFIGQYHGYRLLGGRPGTHRGLPSRHLTFIVSIGPAIDVVEQCDPHQSPQAYRCVLGGLQSSPAFIAHDGNQEGVAIELTPLGARSLFALPARALWRTSVELDELAGSVGTELWERLQVAPTWRERFAACDEVLGRLVSPGVAVDAELRRSWGMLVASGGTVAVSELAEETGWSRQHLARRFRDEFGLSPKLAGRVVRFDRARRLFESAAAPPLATVAAECGYFDQAHLTRDFVDLAGCPPTQLRVGEELPQQVPSVQDAAGAEAGG